MQQNNINNELIGKIIFNKYRAKSYLAEGSFGKIIVGENIKDGQEYALKLETKESGQSLLESEAYILCYLKGFGIPYVKSYGFSGEYNVLVMELLGNNLENLFEKLNKKFSIKTTCMIGLQMLDRIEWVHNKRIVYRDIKPDNFVIGKGDKSHIIYILDFGLSKKYWSTHNNCHVRFSVNKKLTGTARYASINALRGCEQSRRDDVEAIGYVLLYFLRGSLPWQGLKIAKNEDKYKKIYDVKRAVSAEELCQGFPDEFLEFVKYTRNLDFEAQPDYDYLKGLLKSVMSKNNFEFDYFYDWCDSKPVIKEIEDNPKEDKTEEITKIGDNKIDNEGNNSGKAHQSVKNNEENNKANIKNVEENKKDKIGIKDEEKKKGKDKKEEKVEKEKKDKKDEGKGRMKTEDGEDKEKKCVIF